MLCHSLLLLRVIISNLCNVYLHVHWLYSSVIDILTYTLAVLLSQIYTYIYTGCLALSDIYLHIHWLCC